MAVSINISQNGKHLFSTSERSFSYYEARSERFKDTLRRLRMAFPKSEGYDLGVANYEKVGKVIDEEFSDILNEDL